MLHHVAGADHLVMMIMTFQQWIAPTVDFTKTNPVNLFTCMRENVYKRLFLPFSDVMTRFATEAGMQCTVAQTRFTVTPAHVAVLRVSEIDRTQTECPSRF